ncbi:HipA domain-containing protein [Candidatus Nitrospira nitrificans]|uniref:Serine kinase HipA n=1 Tax=Candidatus Nitrospira nitrificans TaxID=1742973 RepID=A0A0S4LTF5_9BACT
MHLKNFAMFCTDAGLRLSPAYDAISVSLYGYKTIALSIDGAANLPIGNLKPQTLIRLGQEFGLSTEAMAMATDQLERRKQAMAKSRIGSKALRDEILTHMETRWNGTFALIGKALSKKR